MERVCCNICGSTDYRILSDPSSDFGIARCNVCGLTYTNPRPEFSEISSYYPEDYYSSLNFSIVTNASEERLPGGSVLTRAFKKTGFYKNYDAIRRRGLLYIPYGERKGRALELGCEKGVFISELKNMGWEVYGVEMCKSSADYAKNRLGLDVVCGNIEDIKFENNFFDLVAAWMVIEHLHNPAGVLRKIAGVLKPDGLFVFSVPNIRSFDAVLFGTRYFCYDIPRHLYHFEPETIKTLLDKSGFKLIKIVYQTNMYNTILSIRNMLKNVRPLRLRKVLLCIFSLDNGLLLLLFSPLGWILSVFGISSNMTLFARVAK